MPTPDVGRDALDIAEARIAAVLQDPATIHWWKDVLGGALGRGPVDPLDDDNALSALLVDRTAAAIDLMIDPPSS